MAKPFAYLLLAALIGYAALANGQAPEATIEADFYSVNDVENSFLSHYVSVTPGQTLAPVSVVLTNPGAEAWPAGLEATLVFPDDGSWVLSGNDGTLVAEEEGEIEEGSSVTLSGWINSTAEIGVHVLTFELSTGEDSTEVFELEVEVTCSDHVFCNGRELWINGTCVSENVNPCRIDYDPQDCASFKCLEKTQRCEYTLEGDDCMPCMGCVPDCNDKECGADGCGGKCGTCESGLACVEGQCTELAIPGSCNDPFPFFAEGVEIEGRHIIRNDTTIGIHQVTPDCNSGSTARELVYHFTIPEDGPTYGVMMQYYGIGELDTVLELRSGSCEGPSVSCNDDAYPPGDYGSRIQLMLEPGEYYLILDHYNEENYGPFELFADFVVDCVPRCNSLYCGDNSCGGDCGPCDSSQVCSESNVCVEKDCEPDCDGRACGDDGCGGSCGDCQNEGELCVFKTGKCEVFEACNHMVPTCEGGCDDNSFCGTDCKCHAIDEPLPDLVVDSGKLLEQIHIEKQTFAESDCAVAEGCILAAGTRRLLRFTVETANHGKGTLVLGDPAEQPLFFSWSPCHGHFHFEGYAHYLLLEDEAPYRNVKERGRKQGYCVYDGYRRLSNPSLPCSTNMSCASQGIQPGWVDNYGWSLDCQWLDITDVEPGDYLIFVEVNFQRKIAETNYDNNKAYVKVTIPEDTDDDSSDDGEDGSPSTMCLPLTGTLLL